MKTIISTHPLTRGLRFLLIAALLAGLAWVGGPTPSAYAASFTVTSTADLVDVTPGDGQCQACVFDIIDCGGAK